MSPRKSDPPESRSRLRIILRNIHERHNHNGYVKVEVRRLEKEEEANGVDRVLGLADDIALDVGQERSKGMIAMRNCARCQLQSSL